MRGKGRGKRPAVANATRSERVSCCDQNTVVVRWKKPTPNGRMQRRLRSCRGSSKVRLMSRRSKVGKKDVKKGDGAHHRRCGVMRCARSRTGEKRRLLHAPRKYVTREESSGLAVPSKSRTESVMVFTSSELRTWSVTK